MRPLHLLGVVALLAGEACYLSHEVVMADAALDVPPANEPPPNRPPADDPDPPPPDGPPPNVPPIIDDTGMGGQIVLNRSAQVTIEIHERATALYVSDIWLFAPHQLSLDITNHDPLGTVSVVGEFPASTELVFEIRVRNTNQRFRTGLAENNDDGIHHARITMLDEDTIEVGFEDAARTDPMFDGDYDDVNFLVHFH